MINIKIPYRVIIAVAAGIAIAMGLSAITHLILVAAHIFPKPGKPMFETRLVIISLIYHSIYAVIAAFFTAMIARDKANKAVFILGTKEAIMWLLGIILLWNHSPAWFNLTKAILGPPLAWIGGQIYKHYKNKTADN